MNKIIGFFTSALSLTALYLVLKNAGGASQVLKTLGSGTVNIFRTFQGR